jgi:hypothetical protein
MAKKRPQKEVSAERRTAKVTAPWSNLFVNPLSPEPDSAWIEFAKAHPQHPSLKDDCIYAIPRRLLEAIRKEAPKFFSPEETQFERDLADAAGVGFFLKRRIQYELLETGKPQPKATEWDERLSMVTAGMKGMLVEEMRENGASDAEIEGYWKLERQMRTRLKERQAGYAGWLVTEPAFRQDCTFVRKHLRRRLERLGGFPCFPMSFFGESPGYPAKRDRPFYDAYMGFYRDWSLHTMATWELPVPMRPEMGDPSFYDLRRVHESGMTLFLPWYLSREKDLKVREVCEQKAILMRPSHLAGWLERTKHFGHDRYAVMLNLYVYLERALKARYGDRIRGNTKAFDCALGRFLVWGSPGGDVDLSSEESIRKIRQEMQKRLARPLSEHGAAEADQHLSNRSDDDGQGQSQQC